MRLLNTKSLALKFFQDGDTPEYAALSYTHLGKSEVDYTDFETMGKLMIVEPEAKWQYLSRKAGCEKLRNSCQIARVAGIQWIYVGICCTDWASRMEMNENAQVGYQRWKGAKVCFVHLADVETNWKIGPARPETDVDLCSAAMRTEFARSRWFKRSWTLQELLAPRLVQFYNAHWQYLGDSNDLAPALERIADIPEKFLRTADRADPRWAPVAQRLAWAGTREALVPEDHVYAVTGLFNLQLDIGYGEREEAFYRFRRELLRKRNCDGSVLITADELKKSRNKLLAQLGHPPTISNAFTDFHLHSMLDASLKNKLEWKDIVQHALEIAKHPPLVIDTQYCFTTIYRPVQDFCVVWIQATQEVAGITFAVCAKVTPTHTFYASADVPNITINGWARGSVFHVRKERLRGFKPCHIYFPIEMGKPGFQCFEGRLEAAEAV